MPTPCIGFDANETGDVLRLEYRLEFYAAGVPSTGQFNRNWRETPLPAFEQILGESSPTFEPLGSALLVELVADDLEFRIESGLPIKLVGVLGFLVHAILRG